MYTTKWQINDDDDEEEEEEEMKDLNGNVRFVVY